ncbi:MAG: carboxypeptidase M32 [Spirochaetales bacterium]|nr:carboxypeptidase M32 [Spirochaetales bacterium]
MREALEKLYAEDRQLKTLEHAAAVLGWDQETYMPAAAVEERGAQLAALSGIIHRKAVSDTIGSLLTQLGALDESYQTNPDLSEADRAFIRIAARNYNKQKKLPSEWVEQFAQTTSMAQSNWSRAKEASDFSLFSGDLNKIIDLVRQKAGYIGYTDHPYDALLDEYELGMTTERLEHIFRDLLLFLPPFIRKIGEAKQVDDSFLQQNYPVDTQEKFSRYMLGQMSFPSERGRLDVSAHPFTTTLGSSDVRITTRYNENLFQSGLFGTIHETGHALYELGFSDDIRGTCLADCPSLGIHESQSRTWENIVGRSRQFWEFHYPELKKHFPQNLSGVTTEQFYRAINKVEPSCIRVEADEVTYNLHIVLRFQIEKDLVAGKISVEELPGIWNAKMVEFLGLTPQNDAEGVLQDIHWAFGGFGYFPTYALGNLYGAQFSAGMEQDIPDLAAAVSAGKLTDILNWLRRNIHRFGCMYPAEDLCRRVTGKALDPQVFIDYLTFKYRKIYAI